MAVTFAPLSMSLRFSFMVLAVWGFVAVHVRRIVMKGVVVVVLAFGGDQRRLVPESDEVAELPPDGEFELLCVSEVTQDTLEVVVLSGHNVSSFHHPSYPILAGTSRARHP